MVVLLWLGACGGSAGDGAGKDAAEASDATAPIDAGGADSGDPGDSSSGGGQDGGNDTGDAGAIDGGGIDGSNGDQLPRISSETLATEEDVALRFTVTASDPAGQPLTITASAPEHGKVAISGFSATYSPVANYNGPDAFVVTASNGERSASATVDMIVVPVNDPPIAVDDAFAAQRNTPLVLAHTALIGNDTDIDGDTLTVKSVSGAAHGTVTDADGKITFTPAGDFTGAASYRYTITDGFAEATATVAISINGSNQPPVATNDTAMTAEDAMLEIAATDLLANDIDDGALTVTGVATATGSHGSAVFAGGTVRFTPEPNYHGPAFFTYSVTDGIATAIAFVDVTVTAVNDTPIANTDIKTTNEDTTLVIPVTDLLANDVDADGPTDHQTLTLTSVGDASRGSIALANGAITFVPELNYHGAASFTYAVSDGIATVQGIVTVNVTDINDAPIAVDDTVITPEDMPLAIPVADLLANDSDADIATDGQLLGVTAVAVPGGLHTVVLADGVATFTPSHNFGGTVIFTYTVSDGALAATGRVSVIVTAVNDPPVPVNQTFSGIEDSPLTLFASDFLFLSSDPDNPRSALSLTGVRATPATHGTVVLAGDRVTYTPDRDFNGQAQFEFTISDGSLTGSALATVNVEARPGAGPRRR